MKRDTPRDDGRFLPGHSYSPATQIVPGEHKSEATEIRPGERLSPATEFKPGQAAHNKLPVGAVTLRLDYRTGVKRAWVKIAEPNLWRQRAVVVWEAKHGPLPRGCVIHHKDRNYLNDSLRNLVALTRSQHMAEHRDTVSMWRKR